MEQYLEWLTLWRIPGIGPVKFKKLVESGSNPLMGFKNPPWKEAEQDLKWAENPEHHILFYQSDNYPALLKEIYDAPPILFVIGDVACLSESQIAMVGSRHPSENGMRAAAKFSSELAGAGLVITSGLAMGIDGVCHQSALEAGGRTIAVMATGPDTIYPLKHRKLADRIRAQGALVTEFPLGVQPIPAHFPRRNRIISGLSRGVLVVEAAEKSGSLITARYANEQGREVFAIPGSIFNPQSKGCHLLLREGAKLVDCVEDVLDEFPKFVLPQKQGDLDLEPDEQTLVSLLGSDPLMIDILIEHSKLTPDVVGATLLNLELLGHVSATPRGYIKL